VKRLFRAKSWRAVVKEGLLWAKTILASSSEVVFVLFVRHLRKVSWTAGSGASATDKVRTVRRRKQEERKAKLGFAIVIVIGVFRVTDTHLCKPRYL